MADMKIEDADEISSVDGTEEFPIAQGNPPSAKKIGIDDIKDYIINAIGFIPSAGDPYATDQVVVHEGNDMRLYSIGELTQKVASIIAEEEEAVEFGSNDTLIVNTEDGAKPVSLGTLAGAIKDNFVSEGYSFNINIAGLTAADDVDATDLIPSAQTRSGTTANKKVTVDQIAAKTASLLPGKATASSDAVANSDYLLTIKNGNVKKVLLQDSGLNPGNVVGAASSTDGGIPQWDGTTGKKLKNGANGLVKVGTTAEGGVTQSNITNQSTNDQLPTSAAVYQFGEEVKAALVKPPETTTDGKIPQWDSVAKTLKDGLAKATSIGTPGSDDNIPTEKAVRSAISALETNVVKCQGQTTVDQIPMWSPTSKELRPGGYTRVTSVGSTGGDYNIPSEKAVRDALSARSSFYNGTITALSDIPTTGHSQGDMIMAPVTGRGTALCVYTGSAWNFIAWLQSSIPAE